MTFCLRSLAYALALLASVPVSGAKTIVFDDLFTVTVPDDVRERPDDTPAGASSQKVAPLLDSPSFQGRLYRWGRIDPTKPLNQIVANWAHGKDWVKIANLFVSKSERGVPYATFSASITRERPRPPFESSMTVVRSRSGEVFMFQIMGDLKVARPIIESISHPEAKTAAPEEATSSR